MTQPVNKQSAAERLFTLTCCLMAAPVIGLSKRDIFASVSSYAQQASEMAKEKMFDRDKTALRDMGVALEVLDSLSFEEGDTARYRIARGSFSWPKDFVINAEHLALLELAAKAWNNQLLSKSAHSGLTRLKSLGVMQTSRELSIFTPRLLAQHDSFAPLADAIANSNMVAFEYRKPDSEQTVREVSPLKLRFIEGQWVLLAKQGTQIKNFLLRRIISKVTPLDNASKPVSDEEVALAEAELADFVSNNKAVLEVEPDTEAWWHFGGPEGSQVEIHFMDEALLAEDLMEFGSEVRVLSPESLATRIRSGLERVVQVHA